jgi:hypothetical protein
MIGMTWASVSIVGPIRLWPGVATTARRDALRQRAGSVGAAQIVEPLVRQPGILDDPLEAAEDVARVEGRPDRRGEDRRAVPRHFSPDRRRSSNCRVWCARSAVASVPGRGRVRRLVAVLNPRRVSASLTRCNWRCTRSVPAAKPTSSRRRPTKAERQHHPVDRFEPILGRCGGDRPRPLGRERGDLGVLVTRLGGLGGVLHRRPLLNSLFMPREGRP